MGNLTVVIDDSVLLRARQRALAHGTSVNALVRGYLEGFAGDDRATQARAALAALARDAQASSGEGRSWTRADAHER